MALNNGAPVLLDRGYNTFWARELLKHPLSTKLDSRIVAACELLNARRE
jgi:hypothetical protein